MNKIELKKFIIFRLSFALQAIQPNLQLELFNLESAFKGNVVFFGIRINFFLFLININWKTFQKKRVGKRQVNNVDGLKRDNHVIKWREARKLDHPKRSGLNRRHHQHQNDRQVGNQAN